MLRRSRKVPPAPYHEQRERFGIRPAQGFADIPQSLFCSGYYLKREDSKERIDPGVTDNIARGQLRIRDLSRVGGKFISPFFNFCL